jgi:hypothetical protein
MNRNQFNLEFYTLLVFVNISNSIGTKGAEHLESFIVQSKTIRTVILSNNDIRDEGALALSKVF